MTAGGVDGAGGARGRFDGVVVGRRSSVGGARVRARAADRCRQPLVRCCPPFGLPIVRGRARAATAAARPRSPAIHRHSPPFGTLARWSKRIRPTGPTCQKTACLHFPRQIAALKHLHTIDPKRTIRRQA
ncbi:hypothetical protein DF050_37160 [Burkholderia cepacia]|nr:hypothetical protein DF050_37160 [Burkholderia cepacia]